MADEFPRNFDRLLAYLNRQRKRFLGERLRPYGLTGVMHMFITFLHRHPGMSQDNLCSTFYIEKCTVSKRVKQLETLGYIRREVDENDRRQNKLFLTPKGEELVPVIIQCLDEWSAKIADGISQEERDARASRHGNYARQQQQRIISSQQKLALCDAAGRLFHFQKLHLFVQKAISCIE